MIGFFLYHNPLYTDTKENITITEYYFVFLVPKKKEKIKSKTIWVKQSDIEVKFMIKMKKKAHIGK